jgi:hypothetical protein
MDARPGDKGERPVRGSSGGLLPQQTRNEQPGQPAATHTQGES